MTPTSRRLLTKPCQSMKVITQLGLMICSCCLLQVLSSCREDESNRYPDKLEKAIDLFYVENQNDSLLNLLDALPAGDPGSEHSRMAEILRAGALAESGDADSAQLILQSLPGNPDERRTTFYLQSMRALTHFRLGHYRQAYEQLTTLEKMEAPDLRAEALNERIKGRILYRFERYDESIYSIITSREMFREAGLPKSVAINDKFLASIYNDLESYGQVQPHLAAAEKVLKEANDRIELFYLYIVAVDYYRDRQMADSARYYTMQAMEVTDINVDRQMQATIWYYLAAIENMQGRTQEAAELLEQIIEMEEPYFSSVWNRIRACTKLARLHNKMQQHERATEYAFMALNNMKEEHYSNYQHEAYRELAIATLQKDPQLARSYMDSAGLYLERHNTLSTADIASFITIEEKLNQASLQIERMQERKRRESLIFYIIVGAVCLLVSLYFLLHWLNKRIHETSGQLVKKNLEQIKKEEKVNELIKNHKELLNTSTTINQLTQQQKEAILFHDFEEWLVHNKRYLDPELNLYTAARELTTNRSYLSAAINAQGVKFTEIINRYRIREAIRIFSEKEDPLHKATVEETATAVGFRSKSVFFDAFRRETGMTPSHFRENIHYATSDDSKPVV